MTEPRTEAGRVTAGKTCWALHALTMEHNPDCTVIREGILAIEAAAQNGPFPDEAVIDGASESAE